MVKFKITKGDKVKAITGKDKGKVGTVLQVLKKENRVIVSGINVVSKHTKATQFAEAGIKKKELPIHISNVSHIDPKSGEATKIGYRILEDGSKVRFSKKSNEIISKEGK
ncbi:MAG: 50S ribosomal protein L24 [Rickettsiaceae bacterium]|nr:50S ribosomal protein L24 [Rickettsiaceae bacterium]